MTLHIFTSASQSEYWLQHNCYKCSKFCSCPLESAMRSAAMKDGRIPIEIVERIGGKINGESAKLGECKEKIKTKIV